MIRSENGDTEAKIFDSYLKEHKIGIISYQQAEPIVYDTLQLRLTPSEITRVITYHNMKIE